MRCMQLVVSTEEICNTAVGQNTAIIYNTPGEQLKVLQFFRYPAGFAATWAF